MVGRYRTQGQSQNLHIEKKNLKSRKLQKKNLLVFGLNREKKL